MSESAVATSTYYNQQYTDGARLLSNNPQGSQQQQQKQKQSSIFAACGGWCPLITILAALVLLGLLATLGFFIFGATEFGLDQACQNDIKESRRAFWNKLEPRLNEVCEPPPGDAYFYWDAACTRGDVFEFLLANPNPSP